MQIVATSQASWLISSVEAVMHLLFNDGMLEVGQVNTTSHSFPGEYTCCICNTETGLDTQASSHAG